MSAPTFAVALFPSNRSTRPDVTLLGRAAGIFGGTTNVV
jgi:hypothetical protein